MSPAFRLAAVVSLAFVAMSCNPRHHDSQQQQQNTNSNANTGTTGNAGPTENGPNLRTACADEIQKYCATDPHIRRCLRGYMDKLGDTCKTAVNTRREFGGGGRRPGIGRACAEELAKFCATDDRKFRCLKDNLDRLGDACKAAVNAPRDNNPQQGGQPTNGNP